MAYMFFKLIYFLLYLTSHIMYRTLCAKTYFFYHSALLELRYLNFGNIINLEQVRFQTFRVNDLLLYSYYEAVSSISIFISEYKKSQWCEERICLRTAWLHKQSYDRYSSIWDLSTTSGDA
jgi:hypothetical protein